MHFRSSAPSPLRTRNYRLYFSGQLVSVPGTWLQTVAQAWLVLQLSASGSALGVTVALQTVPVLVLGAWTGSLADRVDKRRLLLGTQAAQGLLALGLGVLTLTGVVQLWMVWILALGLGVARSFDTPTRQAFVSELVSGEALSRAIGINSTVVSAARMVGPAAGGAITALFGVGVCFVINGASFLGPLCALAAMDNARLNRPERPAERPEHAVRAGLGYVRDHRDLLVPLLMMAIVGTLAFEFQVTIPLMAHSAFHLGATGFGLLYAAMGVGAVLAGLTLAGRIAGRVRTLTIAAAAFAVALGAAAAAPGPATAAVCLAFAGAASVVYSSTTNATLQIRAEPAMRGRVVALYVMAFMGSTAIGGPLVGAIGEVVGPRASLAAGAVGCVAAVLLALAYAHRRPGALPRAARRPLSPPADVGVRDGLAYALFLPERPPAGGVVVLHGAGSQKENHYDFARECRAAGLAAVAFDQRGHGESDGALDGRAIDDVATMAALLPGRGPVALRGSSMGGWLALAAGAALDAAAVVAICPASSEQLALGLRDRRFAFRADEATLGPLLEATDLPAAAASLGDRLLLMHAEGDEDVPVEHSRALHAAAPDSRIEVVPGGDHRSVQHDAEMQALSVRFVATRCAA